MAEIYHNWALLFWQAASNYNNPFPLSNVMDYEYRNQCSLSFLKKIYFTSDM